MYTCINFYEEDKFIDDYISRIRNFLQNELRKVNLYIPHLSSSPSVELGIKALFHPAAAHNLSK